MALISTVDFQTSGIKLSLKITNRIVEKICSAYLLSLFRFRFCKAYCLYVLQGMVFIELPGLENLNRGSLFPGTC